jgi:hypothetical protein
MVENGGMKCPRCGASVPQRPGRGRPRRWCSTACRKAEAARRARQRWQARRTAVLIGEPGGGDLDRNHSDLPARTTDELAEALAARAWPG